MNATWGGPDLVCGKVGNGFGVPKNINRPFIGLINANGHIFGIFAPFKADKTYFVDCAAFPSCYAFPAWGCRGFLYLLFECVPLCGSELVFSEVIHVRELLGLPVGRWLNLEKLLLDEFDLCSSTLDLPIISQKSIGLVFVE